MWSFELPGQDGWSGGAPGAEAAGVAQAPAAGVGVKALGPFSSHRSQSSFRRSLVTVRLRASKGARHGSDGWGATSAPPPLVLAFGAGVGCAIWPCCGAPASCGP